MALMDFIKKQFIDILQWAEDGDGTLAWRFPMQEMEIQNGASLTVRDSQLALFVNEGTVADVFAPGMYKLTTQTLPVLTYLKNWDKLFESPFKSDVYFFSTRTQLDQKWGTPQPMFAEYGLTLDSLVVQNVSLPEELQKVLDQRIGMNMIGDMQRYTQYQVANAIPEAARNEGGMAGMGVGLGAGVGFGQVMGQAMASAMQPAAGAAATAAPVAPAVSADDVVATLEKLHGLVEKGILSEDEFAAKKAELLKKLS